MPISRGAGGEGAVDYIEARLLAKRLSIRSNFIMRR